MNRIETLRFDNLPQDVQIVKSVRAKYYKPNDKLPKKYEKALGLYYDFIDDKLCDLSTNIPIVKNEKLAGKPRYISINGNKIHRLVRSLSVKDSANIIKIKHTLTEYFLKELKNYKISINKYPIYIEFKFYLNTDIDSDNLELFYRKTFLDCIQTKRFVRQGEIALNLQGFIPNDDSKHVIGGGYKVFHTDGNPYMLANLYEYEDREELRSDIDNIEYKGSSLSKEDLVRLATRLTEEKLLSTIVTCLDELYDENGEVTENYFTFWTQFYEHYFKLLTDI